MAHTNNTENYNLPQWVGSDKPTFLGDFNTAFAGIDAQMKTNADGIVVADDKAENATTLANDAQSDVDALTTRVTTAEENIANNSTLIGNNTTGINNLTSSVETINTALTGKQNTITGAASSVTTNNLTTNRALVSDSNGKITNSSVSNVELERLLGVTSNIQTQINSKVTKGIANLGHFNNDSSFTITNYSRYSILFFMVSNGNNNFLTLSIPIDAFDDNTETSFVTGSAIESSGVRNNAVYVNLTKHTSNNTITCTVPTYCWQGNLGAGCTVYMYAI